MIKPTTEPVSVFERRRRQEKDELMERIRNIDTDCFQDYPVTDAMDQMKSILKLLVRVVYTKI